MSFHSTRGRLGFAIGALGVSALVLAGCATSSTGGGGSTGGSSGSTITVGTTDKITFLDPAGSYDNGSFAVMNQIYPFLLNSKPGSADVHPDIAQKAEFTSPTEYTVTLKKGLKFANGDPLTSASVKFSFDRMVKINDPNGPASLLGNLAGTAAPDPTTVVFTLKNGNDQIWPLILSSPAAPIVDEKVFSADKVTDDDTIIKGKAFAGQYEITDYKKNQLIAYKPYSGYEGELGKPANSAVNVKYYADASNLKLAIGNGDIDVAFRSLSATDVSDLSKNKKVKLVEGPGGEIRYIVFNFNTQPYGATTPDADPAKAQAVRQAAADLVDRAALAKDVYKDTYSPLYSFVADGLAGATQPLKSMYGDGNGGPSLDKAKAALAAAGVTTPIALSLQYNGEHYGPSSGDEYAAIKAQLEKGGLFAVDAAADRVGPVLQGPHRRRVPGLPARLVPGLLRRRQLPVAVLPQGELPRQPLRQPRGERPHRQVADRDRQGQAHGRPGTDPGHGREGPVDAAAAAGQAGRVRRNRRPGDDPRRVVQVPLRAAEQVAHPDGAPPHARRCPVSVSGRRVAPTPPHEGFPWP